MKLRNLFFALLALPLAFVACEPEPTPEPEPQDVILVLTSDEVVNVSAAGGPGEITYLMDRKGQDVELTATTEAEWITDLTVDTSITFTVAANEGEAREAKIVATAGTKSFEVTVKQAAKANTPAIPALVITSENPLAFDQNEQMGTITYTIENPKEGVALTAKCNANWISQLAVQEANSQVVFLVAANSGDEREAVVTLTYGMLEEKVTVKQEKYVAPTPEIIIDAANQEFEAAGDKGVIEFHINNAVEGVEATATSNVEWITIDSMADGVINFTVAANEEEIVREGVITIAYGEIEQEVRIMQLFEGYNPGLQYSVFQIVQCWASMENGGKQWNVTFVERDTLHGDMQTVISFALAEPNSQRVADGVYSVENGGILINSANANGFSTYRANASLATDITAAEFTVATDTDAKTISFTGTFQAANDVITLNYTGEMPGMDLGEAIAGVIEHRRWSSVVKNWNDAKELLFTATSADGSLKAVFDFYDYDSDKSLAEGEYPVLSPEEGNGVQHLRKSSKFTYNDVESELAEGSATVEHISGGYKITYNIIDALGREFTGVIQGAIQGAVNPE